MATTLMAIVCYVSVAMMPFRAEDASFFSAFPRFLIIVGVSFVAYAVASKLLKLPEIDPIIARVRKLLFARFDVKNS